MPTVETQPLTIEECEYLKTVYRARRSIFINSFIPLLILGAISASHIDFKHRYTRQTTVWTQKEHGEGLISRPQMYIINFVIIEGLLLAAGIPIYRKRVGRLKKDIEGGVKELVPYEIIRKTYFPQTDQYFISFDDPHYLHHEVDIDFFTVVNEGDTAYIARAPHSKQVFDSRGRFLLM